MIPAGLSALDRSSWDPAIADDTDADNDSTNNNSSKRGSSSGSSNSIVEAVVVVVAAIIEAEIVTAALVVVITDFPDQEMAKGMRGARPRMEDRAWTCFCSCCRGGGERRGKVFSVRHIH